jgi:hypothetical protein
VFLTQLQKKANTFCLTPEEVKKVAKTCRDIAEFYKKEYEHA